MKKIIFLANCNSPHLDRWVDLLGMLNIEVEIWSVHDCNNKNGWKILPNFLNVLPISLQYILAGIFLRFKNIDGVFHAHNTSGYGLMAYLSGKKYIITTYGSEIYNSDKRNIIYKSLIKKILDNSQLITSTSQEMESQLIQGFSIDPSKIRNFSLGVDTDLFSPKSKTSNETKVWIINRRTHPHYNTMEAIHGFIRFIDKGNRGRLIIILGDYDLDYFDKIKKSFDFKKYNENIQIVDKFLSREDLCLFLKKSDFSISTPKTDQLSSSILESMSCGTVPILSNLDTYEEIIASQSCVVMKDRTVDTFEEIYLKTSKMEENASKASCKGIQYILKNESSASVLPKIEDLYAIRMKSNSKIKNTP